MWRGLATCCRTTQGTGAWNRGVRAGSSGRQLRGGGKHLPQLSSNLLWSTQEQCCSASDGRHSLPQACGSKKGDQRHQRGDAGICKTLGAGWVKDARRQGLAQCCSIPCTCPLFGKYNRKKVSSMQPQHDPKAFCRTPQHSFTFALPDRSGLMLSGSFREPPLKQITHRLNGAPGSSCSPFY